MTDFLGGLLIAIKELFKQEIPVISSTKSMTGHSLGATGAQEAIYSIMMLRDSFIAPSINISNLCEEAEGINIITETLNQDDLPDSFLDYLKEYERVENEQASEQKG